MSDVFLSAAIIARNAEGYIVRTIESIEPVVDEVVLVLDNRTTDRTEEFARKAAGSKLKLLSFRWTHNFSDARNESLNYCRGKWILILDADDELDRDDQGDLLDEIRKADAGGMDLITCAVFLDPSYAPSQYYDERFGGHCAIDWRNRIVRKASGAQFRGRVHEQLEFPNLNFNFSSPVPIRFYHRGKYTSTKKEYYRALLTLDCYDDPCAAIPAIYLAEDMANRRDSTRALLFLEHVNPESIEAEAIAGRYWEVRGKISQSAWARTIEIQKPNMSLAAQAADYYQRSIDIDPTRGISYINRAIVMIFGVRPGGVSIGIQSLKSLLERDPANLAAQEMIQLCNQAEGNNQVLRQRLQTYLAAKFEEEQKARLNADGWAPKVEVANAEQLGELLGRGIARGGESTGEEGGKVASRQMRRK